MASSYRQKSSSSGSRRPSVPRTGRVPARTPVRGRGRVAGGAFRGQVPMRVPRGQTPRQASRGQAPRGQAPRQASSQRGVPGMRASGLPAMPLTSVRVGDLERAARAERARKTYRRHAVRVIAVVALIACLALAGVVVYFSDAFSIEDVQVEGVEHLTAAEMEALANVPSNTTLLRVDTGAIEKNLLRDAWVKSVSVNRVFPSTLQIVITERTVAAVVEVPTQNATSTQPWAIASDGMWLMAIPNQDSELGQSISQRIYEDAASALHIIDVPFGTAPDVGTYCADGNVNNALAIVAGMTTELAGQVVQVKATDAESTLLTLENGVEIAFGAAENIRDKERVCLKILEENPGTVAYINVRVVDRPTWRAL